MKLKQFSITLFTALFLLTSTYNCKKETIRVIPTLTATVVSSITANSAITGGEVMSDGGAPVTMRGVCWSLTNPTPTISDNKTSDGSGLGVFTSSITGLLPNSSYYIRAYATNSVGTAYYSQAPFKTLSLITPTITTAPITSITSISAISGGNIVSDGGSSVIARGVCWNTSSNPTVANSKTSDASVAGIFTSSIIGLTSNTTYYVKAYATNSIGTAYGSEIKFTTNLALSLPTVTSITVSNITPSGVTLESNVTSDGNATVTERGVVYSTIQNPTTANNKTAIGSGPGSFTSTVTSLTANTTYYVRAYAINSQGTAYGSQTSFTTTQILNLATVITSEASSILTNSAVLGGNVTSGGNATVTERGVVYSTTPNPTTANSKTVIGIGTGSFSSNVTGLTANTTYYVRSFAINNQGTSYGSQVSFTTSQALSLPTITTTSASSISTTSALLGGSITSDGNASVTERGVIYSTTQNPTTANSKTVIGIGTGSFSSNVTGLLPNTTYYVRAYAINSQGTVYGSQISFSTTQILSPASVTTSSALSISTNSAVLGGNVTSDGNATVTERGIVYSTTQNPTIANTKTAIGTGTGSFSSNVTGLAANTTYYVRAYAINSQGTAYGNGISFTTSQTLSLPTITTSSASSISTNSAVLGGTVVSDGNATVTERGIVYSTTPNPTTSNTKVAIGSGTGSFISTVTGLAANTTYYVRVYAINNQGTAYGNGISFTTSKALSLPTITTSSASSISNNSAVLGGNVTSDGNATVTERGIVYSTTQNPTIANTKTAIGTGTGSFSSTVTGLAANTTYYVRAYAINSQGTAYGIQSNFTISQPIPMGYLITNLVTDITLNSAFMSGSVLNDGGNNITDKGIIFGTTEYPSFELLNYTAYVPKAGGIGSVSSTINTSLSANTKYYVRVYAKNSLGTSYGNQVSFTTLSTPPMSLVTNSATNISNNSAELGGNVTSDASDPITERGVVYASTQNPTTSDIKAVIGSGTGSFSITVGNLAANTTYYVRSYAINSKGTTYGNEISFSTGQVVPAINIYRNGDIFGVNLYTQNYNGTYYSEQSIYQDFLVYSNCQYFSNGFSPNHYRVEVPLAQTIFNAYPKWANYVRVYINYGGTKIYSNVIYLSK